MYPSKSILHAACLIERCCLTAGRGYCISLAAPMRRETIWVTDEHLNLSGSVSATSPSDGHPDLNPEYTSFHVLIPDTVSVFSVWYLSPYAGRTLYLTLDGFTLSISADFRQLEWSSSPLRGTSSLFTGPRYTISEDCLWVTFSSQSIVPQANIAPLFIKCNIISQLLSLPARPFDVKLTL